MCSSRRLLHEEGGGGTGSERAVVLFTERSEHVSPASLAGVVTAQRTREASVYVRRRLHTLIGDSVRRVRCNLVCRRGANSPHPVNNVNGYRVAVLCSVSPTAGTLRFGGRGTRRSRVH